MSELRQVVPLVGFDIEGPESDLGVRPQLRWVPPTSLFVDDKYQRDLGKASIRLIKKLVANFAWRKMKPPIVVQVDEGLHCVDGQHTAIAAATRGIPEIPVFVVDAPTLLDRAESFVAHNKDRIAISPMDIYRARLAAGDENALDAAKVCERAGVRLRNMNQQSRVRIGDTSAVSTIQKLVRRRGVRVARMVLESLVKGDRAPVSPAEIDAVEAVIVVARPGISVDDMARAIRGLGDGGLIRARIAAQQAKRPQKHVLCATYLGLLDRQTMVSRPSA